MGSPDEGINGEHHAGVRCPADGERIFHPFVRTGPCGVGRNCASAASKMPVRERRGMLLRARHLESGEFCRSRNCSPRSRLRSGQPVTVRAARSARSVSKLKDVRVECVLGRVGSGGSLRLYRAVVTSCPSADSEGDVAVFEKEIVPTHTGTAGICVASQSQPLPENPLTRPGVEFPEMERSLTSGPNDQCPSSHFEKKIVLKSRPYLKRKQPVPVHPGDVGLFR